LEKTRRFCRYKPGSKKMGGISVPLGTRGQPRLGNVQRAQPNCAERRGKKNPYVQKTRNKEVKTERKRILGGGSNRKKAAEKAPKGKQSKRQRGGDLARNDREERVWKFAGC